MNVQEGNDIKRPIGSRLKIVGLSLLIMAMTILLYDYALSDFKYWISVCITFIALAIMNYEYFSLFNKTKNISKKE
jgi:hypothetical protein